ncbi:hypothetical protein CYMTET_17411 [Cymbomonas tetramitiformis]|uniref:Uncharacterized protein n=1 Tax=Cymbomonas tetramitiformis TaxID=36881 RepID=A0AAE0L7C1_9CHLO|nr:hypothetical protein CYMTET_17411 [Cymbomonas tetramitiformis]
MVPVNWRRGAAPRRTSLVNTRQLEAGCCPRRTPLVNTAVEYGGCPRRTPLVSNAVLEAGVALVTTPLVNTRQLEAGVRPRLAVGENTRVLETPLVNTPVEAVLPLDGCRWTDAAGRNDARSWRHAGAVPRRTPLVNTRQLEAGRTPLVNTLQLEAGSAPDLTPVNTLQSWRRVLPFVDGSPR